MRTRPIRLAALALGAALVLLLAACGDDDDTADTTATTETTVAPSTTSTTAAPPTTATTSAPATTATTASSGGLPTDPEAYATAFVQAWEVGDQDGALELGTQAAVDAIFAYESGGAGSWSLQQCEGAAGSSYCTFNAGGDPTVVVRVGNEAASQGQPQAVTEVQVSG